METGRKLDLSLKVKRYILLLAAVWTLFAAPGFAGEARTQEAPLVIGIGFDYPPYEFLDENGKAAGYNVDLTEAIAEVMELDVEVKVGPWGDIRQALEIGEIDAVAGMLYSVERDKLLDFSPPFTIIHNAIFVRLDSPAIETEEDLRGKEIIVTRGDIMHDYVLEEGLSDNPVLMDTQAETLRLLASGKHDCALVAKLPGLYWSKELGLSNIEIAGPLLHPSDYSYAVTEGNAALLAVLSEGLAIVGETGRHKEIYDKWLGVLEPIGIPLKTILKYIALALAPVLLLLVTVWSRTLKRQVARRTAELRDEITEHMRTEEKLRESDQRFSKAFRSSPNLMAITRMADGQIVDVSDSFVHVLEYGREEVIGRTTLELGIWEIPEDRRRFIEALEQYGICQNFEIGVRAKSGERRLLLISGEVVTLLGEPHLITVASDVTDRKRAQDALGESRERTELALQGADLGTWDWNVQTDAVIFSERWAEILGYTVDEIGQHLSAWGKLVHPDDRLGVQEVLNAHLQGKTDSYQTEHRLKHKSGRWIWVLDKGRVIERDINSKPLRVCGTYLDITERKLAEEKQRQFEGQVQRAQKFESLGVLAGGVAHDFNNLLTSILGNADMALGTLPEDSPAWRRIAHIEKASMNAASLCSQMLAYAGKGRFIVEPTGLDTVVKEMSHLLRASISKDVVLDLVFEDGLMAVEADATQMQQVVMNLVRNASEAVGDEGGVVTVITGVMDCDDAYLSRSYSRDDQVEGRYVYIEVTDTGCGMDEKTQAKMFEPFFTTKFTGRGLGLAAVLGIIRGHGGAIVVDSRPGRGTTVRVLFPALEHYEPVQTEPQLDLEEPVYTFSGTVLVVDDEESVRDICKFMLETAGFDVITAKNGYEALEMYRKNADTIVCVLLDLTMPHMEGIKVFEQLLSIRDDVRVVLASGYSEEEISKRYARSGIAGFIHKPYLFSTLKAKLHEALHKQPST